MLSPQDEEFLKAVKERESLATPGPWKGCNHVRTHSFDTKCKCGAASVWSIPADTIVCDKYRNDDESGPEPLPRVQELHNFTFIAHSREDIKNLLRIVEELKKQNDMCETDNLVMSKRTHILTETLKSAEKERDGLREELKKSREHITLMNRSWPRPR